MTCVCTHQPANHDRYGCEAFVCCDRTRNNYPGKRHTEHDGADHRAQICQCKKYEETA